MPRVPGGPPARRAPGTHPVRRRTRGPRTRAGFGTAPLPPPHDLRGSARAWSPAPADCAARGVRWCSCHVPRRDKRHGEEHLPTTRSGCAHTRVVPSDAVSRCTRSPGASKRARAAHIPDHPHLVTWSRSAWAHPERMPRRGTFPEGGPAPSIENKKARSLAASGPLRTEGARRALRHRLSRIHHRRHRRMPRRRHRGRARTCRKRGKQCGGRQARDGTPGRDRTRRGSVWPVGAWHCHGRCLSRKTGRVAGRPPGRHIRRGRTVKSLYLSVNTFRDFADYDPGHGVLRAACATAPVARCARAAPARGRRRGSRPAPPAGRSPDPPVRSPWPPRCAGSARPAARGASPSAGRR